MMKRIYILALSLSLFLSPALTSTAKANEALNAIIGIVQLITFDLFADWLPSPEKGMVVSGNGVTLTHTHSFVAGCYVTRNAWSPDGRYLTATGSFCDNERVWDYDSGDLVMTTDKPRIGSSKGGVVFTPDSRTLISSETFTIDKDNPVALRLWDIKSGRLVRKVGGAGYDPTRNVSTQMLIPPQGEILFNSSDEFFAIEVKDLNTFEIIRTLAPKDMARDMALHPTKPLIAFAQVGPEFVQIWDYEENTLIAKIPSHIGDINAIDFSPDGRYLAISYENTRRKMNSSRQALIQGPDLPLIKIWDSLTNKITREYFVEDLHSDVQSVAYSPDGRYLLASDYTNLYVFDAHSDQRLLRIGMPYSVEDINFSPGQNIVALTGNNRTSTWTLESLQTPSD